MRLHDSRRGGRGAARPARAKKRASRAGAPGLEALEGRVVLAASAWSGGVSNLWSVAGNWSAAPAPGNDLSFPLGAAHTSNVNDLTAGTAFGAIALGGSGYIITGNGIAPAGPITDSAASGTDQLNLPLTVAAPLTVSVTNAASTLDLGGAIDGAGGLVKTGAGTAVLTGANTYTGQTAITAGALLVDANQPTSQAAVVSGGRLGGTGTVGAIGSAGGIVDPGDNAPGILHDAGALNLDANSTFQVALDGTTAGTGYGQLAVAGTISLGGTLNVALGSSPSGNEQYTLIRNDLNAPITGTFSGLAEGATLNVSGQEFRISYIGGAGHDVVLTHLLPTTTTLAASDTSPNFGQSITLTATVSAAAGKGTPTGTVQFVNGTTPVGTGTLTNGVATLTTAALPVGVDQVTAVYEGSTAFTTSTSTPPVAIDVAKAPTTTTLAAVPTTSVFGQSVTLTAKVAATTAGIGTPTGTVEFLNGSTEIETIRLDPTGSASLTTATLPVGTDALKAIYQSDNSFATSTSNTVSQVVSQVPTATALTVTPTQPALGQTVTLTAVVAPTGSNTGTPTGTVTFSDVTASGTTISLGTGTLNANGIASATTTALVGGANAITAAYQTDGSFASSTSTATTVTIAPVASTTTLAISPNPSVAGQAVTLSATVAGVGSGAVLPTGTVDFVSGTTILGTGTLSNGVATFTTTSLPLGSTSIAAGYLGSSSFNASASTASTATVTLATTGVTVSASLPLIGPTQTEVLNATVAGAGATPTGTVEFFANGVDLGSATLTNGTASLNAKNLAIGNQAITAVYLGDASNAASTSATPAAVAVGTPIQQYLNAIYLQVFGRPIDNNGFYTIDVGGLSKWLSTYLKGGGFRSPVVNKIVHSKEPRQFAVQATYLHLANKAPSSAQQQNAFVGTNGQTVNLESRVLGGPAYFAAAGSTTQGFLTALGNDVLGGPLPAGYTTLFTNELAHGTSRQAVARQLLTSPVGTLAQVDGLYQRILNRAVDLAGLKTSVAALDNGQSYDRILVNLLSSNEYFRMFQPKSS